MIIDVKYRTLGDELVDYPDELRFVKNELGREDSQTFDQNQDKKHFIDIPYSEGETVNIQIEFCEKNIEQEPDEDFEQLM